MEIKQVLVPDIGNFKDVNVIEVMVKSGDTIGAEQNLITLETDKATVDVPTPYPGVVREVLVKVGDKVSEGSLILLLDSSAPAEAPARPAVLKETEPPAVPAQAAAPVVAVPPPTPSLAMSASAVVSEAPVEGVRVHASPAIRRFARELGVELAQVKGSGEKGRVTKNDVQGFVKSALAQPGAGSASVAPGLQIALPPQVDFTQYGPIETRPLSRIKKISGANLQRNWLTIPHVTQHDEADISDMDTFRRQLAEERVQEKLRITPLAFLLKAVVVALKEFPDFNASLDAGGENLVLKRYYHIGVAVDTPDGLMVPVLRDVDCKGIVELARELAEVSAKARDQKLSAAEMQGGCFTITSLGGIGGTSFTPIINAPEVAILGVSRASMKPVYRDGNFVPRLILPFSLSYDHRVIDGAAAVRFTTHLAKVLSDIRLLTV